MIFFVCYLLHMDYECLRKKCRIDIICESIEIIESKKALVIIFRKRDKSLFRFPRVSLVVLINVL